MNLTSTVLVVDDNSAMRQALDDLLTAEGYDVACASTGAEALEKATHLTPDLILLDVMMPDMDGFTVCQRMRTDPLLAEVPVIIFTSLADRASRLRGLEAGADDYVSKPIDTPELLARVRTITRLNRYRRLLEEQAQRQQAEAALRESEERFRNLVENMPIVCFAFDQQGRILSWNRAAEKIYGYTKGEAVGASTYDLIVTPATREDTDQVIQEVFAGKTIEGSEWQDRDKIGQIGWRMGNTFPLLSADGSVDRGVNLNVDITERKRTERELRLYTERLEILHEIDQGILSAQSPETIIQAALSRIRELIPCQRAGVALVDLATDEAVIFGIDVDTGTLGGTGTRVPLESYQNVLETLMQGGIARWGDLQSRDELMGVIYAEGVRSFVSVPLVSQGELIGALNFGLVDPGEFADEHEGIARQVADQLAIAIQQARLNDQVERHTKELEQRMADRTRELSVLYEVASLASQPLDLETTLVRSLEATLEAVDSDAGAIHLLDEPADPSVDAGSVDGIGGRDTAPGRPTGYSP